MPRRARLTLAGIPLHIIQRGHNRQACFFADQDYQCYSGWLGEYADRKWRVHTYALRIHV
jgi:putative transposase